MNKMVTTLAVLFAVSTCAHANIQQLASNNMSPGEAAQAQTTTPAPSAPPAGPAIVPVNPGATGNCPGDNAIPSPDNDVRSDGGSAPALEL